jgi:hypothetical protein
MQVCATRAPASVTTPGRVPRVVTYTSCRLTGQRWGQASSSDSLKQLMCEAQALTTLIAPSETINWKSYYLRSVPTQHHHVQLGWHHHLFRHGRTLPPVGVSSTRLLATAVNILLLSNMQL